MVTFVLVTFGLSPFVHLRNISAVTDPILTNVRDRLARSNQDQGKVKTKARPGKLGYIN